MAWEHLSINKPHLVYIILGAFTSLFMLCSSLIKERLYIGEATVATLCGVIFGPHAANLIDPGTWGNTDQITLEFSRIVLVVQCFAVGVELPKAYMERHWRSVVLLLVPVMTFGWLITSLFIWAFFLGHLSWLDSLCIAACVTATDPVLASSVVGKGKFAKRVPKHLRDLLSAESGCNDGMAFPFVYLALYIIRYYGHPDEVALHWFCFTILYECVFGAIFGFTIGYIARRLIRYAHKHDLIDRESFLVYYFVLALFCAGSGSLLGMDDLLIGFACGVGFSNDGWFTHETEQSHVSNVIDLLINLAFFVYFGTIIPWAQYNSGVLGLEIWKLVVIAILVLLFRRIPIMLVLKPLIPDIKTWREALFAGHFGPIGVGAIFVAILARAELETGETTPLAELPPPDFEHDNIIELIWPITSFLVICSILVHGSSIAVFTLGKHINTLTLTMSYTKDNDGEKNWMDRLPRIQSRSKSQGNADDSDMDEKEQRLSPSDLVPGTFLRRQREDDNKGRGSRNSSRHRSRRSRNWDNGIGPGGPVSESAIRPARREEEKPQSISRSDSETLAAKSESPSKEKDDSPSESQPQSPGEIYEEGGNTIYEDEDGNVLAVEPTHEHGDEREHDEVDEGRRLMRNESARKEGLATNKDIPQHDTADDDDDDEDKEQHVEPGVGEPSEEPSEPRGRQWMSKIPGMTALRRRADGEEKPKESRGPARAYQYGNTIIVEDEDGEVIKKFDIPAPNKAAHADSDRAQHRIGRMGKMLGLGGAEVDDAMASASGSSEDKSKRPEARRMKSSRRPEDADPNDDRMRFTIDAGGRRLSTAEFIQHISKADPKKRAEIVENSTAPEEVKREARKEVREQTALKRNNTASGNVPVVHEGGEEEVGDVRGSDDKDMKLVDEDHEDIPFHDVSSEIAKRNAHQGETAAARRRRLASKPKDDSDDDGSARQPPRRRDPATQLERNDSDNGETAAERRRRLGALGKSKNRDSDSEEEEEQQQPRRGIKFDESTRPGPSEKEDDKPRGSMLRWGENRRG